jgi:hypothetical protein
VKKLFQILAVAVAFVGIAAVRNASAVDAPFIGITPAQAAMELIPGYTYTGTFQVTNPGEVEFDYTISVKPYKVYGEDYTPDFKTKDSHSLITDWVTFSSTSGHLYPHTSSDPIHYTITVPDNIEICGQYAAIAATAAPNSSSEGSGILNITSAAMIVYAAIDNCDAGIAGNVRIIENNVPTFIFTPPLNATSLVENNSSVHVDAEYTLEAYPIFSDEKIYEDTTTAIIMPETKRFKTQKWENAPFIGIYKVRQTVKIYDQVSVEEKIVIICPLWLIFLIVFAIIMMIFWLRARSKSRNKKYQ